MTSPSSRRPALGVDPGVTTGLYLRALPGQPDEAHQVCEEAVTELVADLLRRHQPRLVLIEDFVGGGPRTREAKVTLLVIGRVLGLCEHLGFPVLLRDPQRRRACLARAREIHSADHAQRHATDALAHLLRQEEEEEAACEFRPPA